MFCNTIIKFHCRPNGATHSFRGTIVRTVDATNDNSHQIYRECQDRITECERATNTTKVWYSLTMIPPPSAIGWRLKRMGYVNAEKLPTDFFRNDWIDMKRHIQSRNTYYDDDNPLH